MDKKIKGVSDIEAIKLYIAQFEKDNKVKFLYLAETGSRAYELSTKHSDYDVKGIFIDLKFPYSQLDKEEFLGDSFCKSKQQRFKQTGIKVRNIETEVDIDFFELNFYFQQLQNQEESLLYWLNSEFIYFNQLNEFSQTVLNSMNLPRKEILERISKDYEKVKNQQKREAKKNINMIIDSLRLIFIQLFNKNSPYKITELIEQLQEKFSQDLQDSPINDIIQSINQEIQELFYMKKNGKGTQLIIPKQEWIQLTAFAIEQEKKTKIMDDNTKQISDIKDSLFNLYNEIIQNIKIK